MDNYQRAKKIVRKKKAFYQHLAAYIAVIGFLMIINILSGDSEPWFLFPAAGWGIGLSIHYFNTFGFPFTKGVMSPEWEDREIEKEMEKLEGFPERPEPDEELELKEFKKLRSEWGDDQEFV